MKPYQKMLLLAALPLAFCLISARADDASTEARINALIAQMTLPEKVAMCQGASGSAFQGVPRLGIPDMQCSDGPRGPHGGNTTAFPCGVAFGATWDPLLIEQAATAMGQECRAKGVSMLLGPGINIQRDPLDGRFFEYYTEDPYLNARLAVAYTKGVQSQRVSVCLKHFVCNNREDNRNNYMSMVSERALNEIYFPAFKAAVEQGQAWAVMTSANGVNGEFVSDNKQLLHDTLKDNWGFSGMVITDWLGTRSTQKAALAGLDVSMPYRADSLFGQPLMKVVQDGEVPESVIDDKVRRVLRTMARVGLLEGISPKQGGSMDTPEHYTLARRVTEESLVLLKNNHATLPLDLTQMHKILVVGPNANRRFCLAGLGGSSWVESAYEITPLAGIRKFVGTHATVEYVSADELGGFEVIPASVMQAPNGQKGFAAGYFDFGSREPEIKTVVPEVNFLWEMRSPDPAKIHPDRFKSQFTGAIVPPVSGTYTLRVTSGDGTASLFVNPRGGAPLATSDTTKDVPSATATVQMQAGRPFYLRIEYTKTKPNGGDALCRLEWQLPTSDAKRAAALERLAVKAKAADAVLVFAGIDHSLDSEGRDRTDMHFPEAQQTLIRALAKSNPRTIVTLINGSPLELGDWLDDVPAVLEAWYPGMEGGTAIAEALFGQINPSGHLPFSWPKLLADSPAHAVGTETQDRVDYKEGLMVGYRYFDTKNIAPQFPFGFGLSYTTFQFENLKLTQTNGEVTASVTVQNTGSRAGAETVQLYVHELHPPVERPVHELKAFQKIQLTPGETKTVTLELDRSAFSYYSPESHKWELSADDFEIQVGDSSRDIRLTGQIDAGKNLTDSK